MQSWIIGPYIFDETKLNKVDYKVKDQTYETYREEYEIVHLTTFIEAFKEKLSIKKILVLTSIMLSPIQKYNNLSQLLEKESLVWFGLRQHPFKASGKVWYGMVWFGLV